jgi:hypothetical protein
MASIVAPGHTFTFDPDAKLIYGVEWGDWLGDTAAIANSDWTLEAVDPDTGDTPLTKDNESTSGTRNLLRLMGGTAGRKWKITNHVTTNETPAQEDDRSFFVKVKER